MSRPLGRVARLREIESLLFRKPQGMRVSEIAELCNVDRRTIYRDLDLLSEAGIPIWQEGGRYGIIKERYLATIRLSFNEAAALYTAARLLARHADEHNPHIISALNKLATAFPDPLAEYITRTAEAIGQQPVNTTFVNVLETITLCWAENRKARLWYRSPRSGTLHTRDFSPYMIEPSNTGGIYVIGYDDWAEDIRTFKLERLERVEKLAEPYTIPEEFDPHAHLAHAWGIMSGKQITRVELQFSPSVAAFIRERIWHPSQQLSTLEDGSIRLVVHVADPREMRPWIRSWGGEVEVLEPANLRQELIDEARRMCSVYDISTR